MNEQNQPADPPPPSDHDPLAASHEMVDVVDSSDLLKDRREITIRHGEELYRLRLTKSGKLILHK